MELLAGKAVALERRITVARNSPRQIHEGLAGQPCCCNQLDVVWSPKLGTVFVGKNHAHDI
jgi:hypothetical protein